MLLDYPGTQTIRKSTYEAVIDDICINLIQYGFTNILFINGHAGNVETINYLARRYQREHGVNCGQIDWWKLAATQSEGIMDLNGRMAHGHASECGTSVMLYLRPELVDMSKATRVEPPTDPYCLIPGFIRYGRFKDRTPNGIVGDATIANAEKGKRLVDRCVELIVAFVESGFGSDCIGKSESFQGEQK
ncbi:MAG: creatininase family protein [Spirochaetota bacterium]